MKYEKSNKIFSTKILSNKTFLVLVSLLTRLIANCMRSNNILLKL